MRKYPMFLVVCTSVLAITWWAARLDTIVQLTKPEFRSVLFIDSQHGWIAGSRGVFFTKNGGKDWTKQNVRTSFSRSMIYPASLNVGFIAWADDVTAIVRSDTGFVVGGPAVKTWKTTRFRAGYRHTLDALSMATSQEGWAASSLGSIYKTIDGGLSWMFVHKYDSMNWKSVFALNTNNTWIVGENGALLHTADGENWIPGKIKSMGDLLAVRFLNEKEGWICGSPGLILHSVDGGNHWARQPMPETSATRLQALSFVSPRTGWIVGGQRILGETTEQINATILYTDSAGSEWRKQTVAVSDYLVDVQAMPGGIVWAVGQNGTILNSKDYGANWSVRRLE